MKSVSAMILGSFLMMAAAASASTPMVRGRNDKGPSNSPVWPSSFNISFTETNILITDNASYGSITTGALYYDFTNKRERLDRASGLYDGFCGSVLQKDTPCNIYVVEGIRYLRWPKEDVCCQCCTAANGCGILKPDWVLDANSTYLGQMYVEGNTVDGWEIQGGETNYWYQTTDDATPIQLIEGKDIMYYWPDSFQKGPIPSSIFDLPSGCDQQCSDIAPKSVCAEI